MSQYQSLKATKGSTYGTYGILGSRNAKLPRLVDKNGQFHIEYKNLSWWRLFNADKYNALLNSTWWKLLLISLAVFSTLNLGFAGLYCIDLEGIQGARADSFADAFFFAVQTISTIGYGNMYPKSLYANVVVFFECFFGLLMYGFLSAIFFAKLARPSRLRKTLIFSDVAVINDNEHSYSIDNTKHESYSQKDPCLAFRFVNMRKRQILNANLRLLLIRRVSVDAPDLLYPNQHENYGEEAKNGLGESKGFKYVIEELPYEINLQYSRARDVNWSALALPLPWHVVHPLDQKSPLRGLSELEMTKQEVEIIALFEGVDELTSMNFQARWSYLPKDIHLGYKFEECVYRTENGRFGVDYAKLSQIIPTEDVSSPQSTRDLVQALGKGPIL